MTSTRRFGLMLVPLLLIGFMAGLNCSTKPKRRASAGVSQNRDGFSAPHKPLNSEKESPSPSPQPGGNSNHWVIQDQSPLYREPGLNQPVQARLARHTPVVVLVRQEDWVQVQATGGQSGWMNVSQLQAQAPQDLDGVQPGSVGALAAVQSYFQHLNQHHFSQAYDLLAFDFKRELPYRTFSEGYAGLEQVQWQVVRVEETSATSQVITVEMLCQERPKSRAFRGRYRIGREQEKWVIAAVSLEEISPQSLPNFPSQALEVKPAFADPKPEPPADDFSPKDFSPEGGGI